MIEEPRVTLQFSYPSGSITATFTVFLRGKDPSDQLVLLSLLESAEIGLLLRKVSELMTVKGWSVSGQEMTFGPHWLD
jgi:hypothetical protein